jgi:hypothetical protein
MFELLSPPDVFGGDILFIGGVFYKLDLVSIFLLTPPRTPAGNGESSAAASLLPFEKYLD